ncbi:unnamed protein product [Orchesella dallaii]|uniref:Ionotropic glutamate receptor C-terminal domain-containing protein n=1 Tax=Orchesella dallaii TaxID=48710 RepID=A0ABP1S300_9HEXA
MIYSNEIVFRKILIPSWKMELMEKIKFILSGTSSHRQNFGSQIFPGAAMKLPGLASEKFKPQSTTDSPLEFEGGANVIVYRFLRDALNFSEKAVGSTQSFVQGVDGLLKNEGTVRIINQNEAGIAITMFENQLHRQKGPHGIFFLHAFVKRSNPIAVFVQPLQRDLKLLYGRPYSKTVWLSTLAICILVLVICSLTLFALWKCNAIEGNEITGLDIILECIQFSSLWTLSISTRQGDLGEDRPFELISLRLTIIVASIFSLIFYTGYSSTIISILTVDTDPISSLHQLFGAGYSVYVNKFNPSLIPLAVEVYHKGIRTVRKVGGSNLSSLSLGIESALPTILSNWTNSRTAFITDSQGFSQVFFSGKYSNSYLCSKLSTIRLKAPSARSSPFIKKGAPYRDALNVKILLMMESGLAARNLKYYIQESSLVCSKQTSKYTPMDAWDTFFTLTILFTLSSLSLAILALEQKWKRLIVTKTEPLIFLQ